MQKEINEYIFECIDNIDFKIELNLLIDKNIFLSAFNNIKKTIEDKTKKNTDKTPEDIDSFIVPNDVLTNFKSLFKTASRKQLNDIRKQVLADGINILCWDLTNLEFNKNLEKNWVATLKFKGQYNKV